MGKHDAPPFRMVIERGRLVPATPYDAERLDTYRSGMRVNVRLTEERDRVLVRKWWAIIGLVIKQCQTPWKTKDEASEAIKLALGIVNLSKTIGGDFMAYPKSLTELDDPELQEAVDDMVSLLHRITGVDPETLRKEAANVGEDEHEPSDQASPLPADAGDDITGVRPSGSGVVADSSADEAELDGAGEAGSPVADPAPSSTIDQGTRLLMLECAENMIRDATGAPVADRASKVMKAAAAWKREAIDAGFVDLCQRTAERLIADPTEDNKAKATAYLKSKIPGGE